MPQTAPSAPPASRGRGPRPPRRLLRWTWPLLAALILGVIGGVGVAAAIHMPRVDDLADFTPSLVTQFYDAKGEVFTTFSRERRVMLKPEQIPPVMQQAILASEDSNFFQHGGIDALGIARAAVTDLRHGKIVEGASTITMQLARTVFLSRERTWRRKVEEAMLAVELEKNYSKEQILTLYLNLVNLGHGNYGIEAASRYYFGKTAKDLTLTEAATLAGIIPAPSRYSPYRVYDVVLSQRDRVLRRMFEERFITREEYNKAVEQPLLVAPQQAEEKTFAPYFAEDIRKHLETTYGATQLYQGGLQVRTTLDPQIQRDTEKAVRSWLLRLDHRRGWRGAIAHLDAADLESQQLPTWGRVKPVPDRWYQGIVLESGAETARVKISSEIYTLDRKGFAWTRRSQPSQLLKKGDVAWFRLEVPEAKPKDNEKAKESEPPGEPVLKLEQEPRMEGAAVIIEHQTGAIRAMVGGWDFERNKFNRITQAKRQVGSAFKPFVYGAALEAGWTPSDTLLDAPTYFRGADGRMSYRPENYYKKHYGIVTLRRALEQSINVPAVKLFDVVGGKRVVDFARRCGINTPLPTYPSIALGAADLTPLELAAAFATIANRGTRIATYTIEKVVTADGQVLEQRYPATYTATDPTTAYMLTHMMEGVVDRGTAFELKSLPIDIAGKTGTTDDFSDAWFAGFTPRYTIVVWVGYDVKRTLGYGMSGAIAAVPMWKGIAEAGLKSGWLRKDEKFQVPPGIVFRQTEYRSGLLAKADTGAGGLQEAFRAGTEPTQEHSSKWSTITNLPWYQQKAFYIPKEGENVGQSTDAGGATPPPEPGPEPGEASAPPAPAPQEQPAEPPPP
ncbi:MAG TPA: PBP1A family penicillin-binding protein [Thermoanaerobaculia bacterium]|nr:PBP1A family penicillin-binding protein [Thermoanaerobaculia bacterium]